MVTHYEENIGVEAEVHENRENIAGAARDKVINRVNIN
jgi:hypothetical protein